MESVKGIVRQGEQRQSGTDPRVAVPGSGSQSSGRHRPASEVDDGGECLRLVDDVQSVRSLCVLGEHREHDLRLVVVLTDDARRSAEAGRFGRRSPAVPGHDVVDAGTVRRQHDQRRLDASVAHRSCEIGEVA